VGALDEEVARVRVGGGTSVDLTGSVAVGLELVRTCWGSVGLAA
jgi:hypothetical protein